MCLAASASDPGLRLWRHFYFLQKYYDKREEQVQNHEAVRLRRFPYNVGDYVLVAIRERPNSISPVWSSPGRITTRISDWEYEVENIETKVKSRHHIKNCVS